MQPKVTVLMAVYNGEQYLKEAVGSILAQTFPDFELLVIDDGSTDHSPAVITSFHDSRIRLVKNEKNIGLTKSLNRGLGLSRGEYIARMDADEISMPSRLAKQVSFLEENQRVGVCGTLIRTKGDGGYVWPFPLEHEEIRARLLFENCFAHSSVMIRCSLVRDDKFSYNEKFSCAQDYELWVRLSRHTVMANIGECLLRHRIHDARISHQNKGAQENLANNIRMQQLAELPVSVDNDEGVIHHKLAMRTIESNRLFFLHSHAWLTKLQYANSRAGMYSEPSFSKELAYRMNNVLTRMSRLGWWAAKIILFSPVVRYAGLPVSKRMEYLYRSFFYL